jgi:hypothetical protein
MKHVLIALLSVVSSATWAADLAGNVVFTAGDAQIRHGSEQKQLKRGDPLYAGDVLVTGSSGYIHVRTVDQGFVSLRPSSRLTIEQYHYNPDAPSENAIKFRLEDGVMRSVTGKGGEAAKDRFRLNTPVAAIGIRGTDFTVFTSAAETRVSIRRGGVAVSPFNSNCLSTALGPCSGSSVMNMFAGKLDQVLQVHRNDAAPVIKHDLGRKLSPDSVAPPLPEEKDSQSSLNAISTILYPSDTTLVDVAAVKPATSVHSTSVTPTPPVVVPPTPPAPVPSGPPKELQWGRWADTGVIPALAPDQELIVANERWVISRSAGSMALPDKGSFNFNLANSEAWVLSAQGSVMDNNAAISNANLTVNFDKRTFNTGFTVTSSALPSAVNLSASNSFGSNGQLNAVPIMGNGQGNMVVSGALSGDGKTAAYNFMSTAYIPGGQQIKGFTAWKAQ